MEADSTTGAWRFSTSRILWLFSLHASHETGTIVALGHSRIARAIGIAECTPKARAS
jgi:hypothetical protein